jgi:hypothetical protein
MIVTDRSDRALPPVERMANYRRRMRDSGLKLIQMWVPDTRAPGFAAKCRRQAKAIARHDPAGDDALRFIESVYEWPEE